MQPSLSVINTTPGESVPDPSSLEHEERDSLNFQEPRQDDTERLLTLNFRRGEASATLPNPALLAQTLKTKFPGITSISPQKYKTALLLEVHDDHTFDSLLAITELDGTPVSIHRMYNEKDTSKASFECEMLSDYTGDELARILKNQGVIEAYRKVRTSNGQKLTTNTYVLTFDSPEPPKRILIDSLSINLEIHLPKPRLCFNCQWYGHVKADCTRETVCARCSKKGHDYSSCQETPLCIHCHQNHPASDRKCPMYQIEKLVLERKFRSKSSFQEARQYIYSAYPDLTNQIPRLRAPVRHTPLPKGACNSKIQTEQEKTYSQATNPKEPAITKATQDMIEALILTVEKQQEQIALLIGELTNMKSQFESMTLKTTSVETKITSDTETLDAVAQTEDIHYVKPTKSTQTENASHDTETQTTPFDPIIPFSPSSLSFLKETKVDNTLELETSHLNESEEMESRDGTSLKRKCISPIEAPKPEPTSPTDRNLQLSFATVHESDQSTSPTIGMNASHSHSDFAVDYHDVADHAEELNTQEESDPEESSTQSNDQDTDSTEGHQEQELLQETRKFLRDALTGERQTLCVVQAYFFNKKLAQKMNATEIKTAVNHYLGGPYVCSVLQLKSPHGGHFIYIHSTNEERITPPFRFNLLSDTVETLEVPRKKIDKICECPEIFWYTSAGN